MSIPLFSIIYRVFLSLVIIFLFINLSFISEKIIDRLLGKEQEIFFKTSGLIESSLRHYIKGIKGPEIVNSNGYRIKSYTYILNISGFRFIGLISQFLEERGYEKVIVSGSLDLFTDSSYKSYYKDIYDTTMVFFENVTPTHASLAYLDENDKLKIYMVWNNTNNTDEQISNICIVGTLVGKASDKIDSTFDYLNPPNSARVFYVRFSNALMQIYESNGFCSDIMNYYISELPRYGWNSISNFDKTVEQITGKVIIYYKKGRQKLMISMIKDETTEKYRIYILLKNIQGGNI